MADATTTRPARARKATAPRKATPAKAAPAAEPTAAEEGTQRFVFDFEELPPTKNYAVFAPPKSSGCVGKVYVPLGTTAFKGAFIGPAN